MTQAYYTYIAITTDGNVYGGQTMNLAARRKAHRYNKIAAKKIIALFPSSSETLNRDEFNLIQFLVLQSHEEAFDCSNVLLRKKRSYRAEVH